MGMMVRIKVDEKEVELPVGSTVLDGAKKLGIAVPTLCHMEGRPARSSCMVCIVKVRGTQRMVPACSSQAEDGMEVESGTDEVREARKTAIELLLSEHAGECIGLCSSLCPAGMDIPLAIRLIAEGSINDAIRTIKKEIALPAVLHRICPAPCEKGCRRAAHDAAVSIRLLIRHAADADLASGDPVQPCIEPDRPERAAVIGSGPAGLAAAYHLRMQGFRCTVFDDREKPGGMLRYGVPEDLLPREVLDAEISSIERMGVELRMGVRVGEGLSLDELRKGFQAVLVATGTDDAGLDKLLSESAGPTGIAIDRQSFETGLPGVFAAGNVIRQGRLAVRSLSQGKRAAFSMGRFLAGEKVIGKRKRFTTRLGKLGPEEMEQLLSDASAVARKAPVKGESHGFGKQEAVAEAQRCLKCGCPAIESCELKRHAVAYEAQPGRFKGERRELRIVREHAGVIYEPGKCILCGRCVRITRDAAEELGLAFVGRGYNVRIAVPFDRSLTSGLARTASECVEACPTGSLVFK